MSGPRSALLTGSLLIAVMIMYFIERSGGNEDRGPESKVRRSVVGDYCVDTTCDSSCAPRVGEDWCTPGAGSCEATDAVSEVET